MGSLLLGTLSAEGTSRSVDCVPMEVPLAPAVPFSATSYCKPAPKSESAWAVYFPFVHMLTTDADEPLDEAYT